MRSLFFYTIGIAITSGIFLRSFFSIGYAGIGFVVLVGVTLLIAWRIKTRSVDSPLCIAGLICVFFALGMVRLEMAESLPSVFREYEGREVSFEGRIAREPEVRETNVQLFIDPMSIGSDSRELILVTTDKFSGITKDFSYGDVVSVQGTLKLPQPFDTDTGRTFDYPGYLKAHGAVYTMSFAKIEVVTQEHGTFLGYLFTGKKKFQEALELAIPEPYAGLGEGVLLGVKRALGKDLEQTFRETGIIHIVVLSGYNIMLVVEGMMFVLAFFCVPKTRMVIGAIVIVLFAILVGLSATVVRASLMAILALIARGTGRRYAVVRGLIFAGVAMLLHNPYLLVYDPGFQLSFLATLGLVLVSPHIESRLTRVPAFLGMRGFMAATLATQLFVLPILLYEMGTFSIVAVLVNVLVLPMVPVAMVLTAVTGLVSMLTSTLGLYVGYLAYLSLGYIITIAEFFGQLPFASFTVRSFPFWVVLALYSVLACILVYLGAKGKDKIKIKSSESETIVNDYEGWTIVAEQATDTNKNPEARSASGSAKDPLPFR